jgi:hypothetical protein
MAETVDPAERRDIARWQKRLLPFVLIAISAMGAFFFISSIIQLNSLSERISFQKSPGIERTFTAFEAKGDLTNQADRLDYLRWKTMVMLEQDVVQRRYAQVNATTMLSAWTRHLGFLTGMILTLVGAVFILSKLSESPTTLSGEGGGAKAALETSSPGIILVVLGTVLMVMTLVKDFEFTTTDAPVYIGRSEPAEAARPPPPALDTPEERSTEEESLFGRNEAQNGQENVPTR